MTDQDPATPDTTPAAEVKPKRGRGRPRGSTSYTQETIHRALLTTAKHGGNMANAAKELNHQGIPVTAQTLSDWRNVKFPDLYRHLHTQYQREIEAALVPEYRDIALRAAQATHIAVEASINQIQAGEVKDLAAAARNLATTGAIAMDKLYLATDRPTEVRTDRDAQTILAALAQKAPFVNSTATEEPAAKELTPLVVPEIATHPQTTDEPAERVGT